MSYVYFLIYYLDNSDWINYFFKVKFICSTICLMKMNIVSDYGNSIKNTMDLKNKGKNRK